MGQVRIRIGDNTFRVSCNDGQEDHVREVARNLGVRIEMIRKSMPGASEARIISMTIFTIFDELEDANSKLKIAEAELSLAKGRRSSADQVTAIDTASDHVSAIMRRLNMALHD